jgi:hypothetical protein
MALSPELQAQVDMQIAIEEARVSANAAEAQKHRKMEALRLAKEILVENRRTKAAAEASDIDDADVTNFAASLTSFVNS